MSNRELARETGRSEAYIRARVNDEKEWTLNDLERICNLWGITPSQLIDSAPHIPPTDERAASDLADRIVADPGSFGLAASTNPDKENEMSTPRE